MVGYSLKDETWNAPADVWLLTNFLAYINWLPVGIHSMVSNFIFWLHIGAVMHCSVYMEPWDGAVSVVSPQQEAGLHVIYSERK
jgi:hypothetical protein